MYRQLNGYNMLLLAAILCAILILGYYYGTRTFDYWSKRGVKHDPPIPFFGTAKRQFLHQISYADIYDEMYWKYPKERFVGYYLTTTPLIILRDPELIKRILVSDFNYFYGRSVRPLDKVPEPMLNNLFSCEGDLWKLLRQRLTPAFTSGKLKAMFPLIVTRAEKLQILAAEAASSGSEVDIREIMARYTTEFIGACGFGIDTDTLSDENSLFRKLGRRIFTSTKRDTLVAILKYLMPSLFTSLHFLSPFVENNTILLVKTIMARRDYKPSGRNDFIDMLLELKGKGILTGDSLESKNADGSARVVEIEFDDVLVAAQVYVFFAAGFETSSSATSYTLHELAHHPEHQRKCQEEIDEVLARHGNKLSYEAVKEMKYLDMCFSEGLRIFPSLGYLMRKCEKPYTIPDTNITIDKGVKVIIPVKSLHADPLYWDKPEEFRPERFHPDNASKINKHVYLPFGEGPRACIGERLGHMQSLAGMAALLSRFSVAPGARTIRHPPIDPKVILVQSIRGMRIFPSLGYLMRKCEKSYTIPDTNITIDKGVKVIIPVKSLHADPLYWDKPEEFRPDRFHPDNVTKINKHVYLPFGEGPRACIGERLGHMQSLAGMAALLSRFSVAPSASTIRHPPIDPAVIVVQSIRGGLPLTLIERKKQQ